MASGHQVVGGAALLGWVPGDQQVHRRQRVGTLDDPVQRLGFPCGRRAGVPAGRRVPERAASFVRVRAGVVAVTVGGGRRPGRRPVVWPFDGSVVVAVGKVVAPTSGVRVVAGEIDVVVVLIVGVAALEHSGCRTWPRSVSGTSRMVVPVSSSTPNSAPMNNSGAAIHAVKPSDSGPPMAKPMNPAARRRNSGSSGDPDQRWHRPSTDRAINAAPRISRGRASGLGSVRINTTAITAATDGQQQHGRADERAQHRVDPRADRPGGVEPRAGGDHDGDAQQNQRDPVAAVAGLDVVGAPDRPRGAAGSLGGHHPGRAHGPAARRARR